MTKTIEPRQLLHHILNEISVFQNNLLEIHNEILKQRFGQEVDYKNLEAATLQACEVFMAIIEVLEEDKRLEKLNEKDVLAINNYVKKLLNTASILKNIIFGLHKRAQGQKYSWINFRRDLKTYRKAQRSYIALGDNLNILYREYSN